MTAPFLAYIFLLFNSLQYFITTLHVRNRMVQSHHWKPLRFQDRHRQFWSTVPREALFRLDWTSTRCHLQNLPPGFDTKQIQMTSSTLVMFISTLTYEECELFIVFWIGNNIDVTHLGIHIAIVSDHSQQSWSSRTFVVCKSVVFETGANSIHHLGKMKLRTGVRYLQAMTDGTQLLFRLKKIIRILDTEKIRFWSPLWTNFK